MIIVKKIIGTIIGIASALICFAGINASAAPMEMYINEQYVERDIVSQGSFDMLPIADIAGELGFTYQPTYNGFKLNGYNNSYTFTMGSANVYDAYGRWIGLDIITKVMDGKIRVPETFLTRNLGYSYTWDYVTNVIYVNSPNALNEAKSSYWYEGWKRAADGTVENYWHSIVPDYGNLSGETPLTYYLAENGWTFFHYDFYIEDADLYINYLYKKGWKDSESEYEDVYFFEKNNMLVGVVLDYESEEVVVGYIEI